MNSQLDDWSSYKCSKLFDQISTNTKKIKTKECKETGKYPVVDQGASLLAGYVDDETKVIELESPICIFGDHTRAIKWIDFNFVPGADGTKVLQPKEFLNPRFFYFLLKSIYIEDKGYARHFKLLKDADVKVPSLDVQTRIADKLDLVLAKVEAAQARLDKIPTILKRFRQSVLAAATSGELTKDWRKENDVEGWLPIKVGKIVEKIEAGKNIKCQERPPEENEFGIIKISAVTWGIYNEDQSKTLNDNSLFLENRRVKVGDFLISRANTLELLGMPVIVHQVTKNLMLSDKVLRLVMDEVNKEWLNIFLRSPLGRKEIESRATGNQQSMRNIGQKALLDIDLQLPSEPEKLEIVRCVSELLSNAGLVEKKYQAAKLHVDKMTQSILARAFSGKLFSPISEDEREDVEVNSQPKKAKPDSAKAAQVREKDVADKSDDVPESKVVSSPAIENHSEQTGEVFKLLKNNKKGMSAQALFDDLSDNTFSAIDDIFSELKRLIEQKVVIQTGVGENSTFKVTKK
ncbi:restriction endonuclease subunit S [Pseudoalteromonas sp. APC 3224]|uniref:restriction endonuclease subunit S n=1 Tax=Pseudoalteromonas sp. APC 3224 TaxID=3035203 RepID=UPI0025B2E61E|nr:restriction endonuclease subunit S [Pseudoalteromonas sp. APC 3224]MDN3487068.1 restriction endonuclease subunit S [Pseudoalteromonas sp. APC 3224]